MPTEHEAWLALVAEEALEPDLPICDAHHHLWDWPNDRHYVRLGWSAAIPDYGLDALLRVIGGGHKVTHTVFVECMSMYSLDWPEAMQSVGETEYIQRVSTENAHRRDSKTNVAAGIVGFANLTLGDRVTPVLEAHIQAAKVRLRGIRHSCAWDPSPDIWTYMSPPKGQLLDPRYRRGIAQVQKMGLSFDALHYHTQFMELVDLV